MAGNSVVQTAAATRSKDHIIILDKSVISSKCAIGCSGGTNWDGTAEGKKAYPITLCTRMAPPDEIQLPLSSREQQASPTRIKIEEGEDMAIVLMDEDTIDGSIRQQEEEDEDESTNNRIQLSPRMALKTRFPNGCPVVYDNGESRPVHGHVASVELQVMDEDGDGCLQSGQCIQLFYTIETIPNKKNKTDNDTEDSLHELVAPEDTLSYSIHCPVFVSLPHSDAEDDCWLEGSIRMSYTTYLTTPGEEEVPTLMYHVDVPSNDGRKQTFNGLSSENLRFRSNNQNKPKTIQKKKEKTAPIPVQINKEVLPVRRVSNICNNNQVLVPCSGTISSAQSVGTLNSNSNHQDPSSSISTSSTHQNSNQRDPQRSISTSTPHLPQENSSARQKREEKALPALGQINKELLPVQRVSNSCNNNQVLAPCSGVTIPSAPSVGTNHQDPQWSISTSNTHLWQEKSSARQNREEKAVPVPVQINNEVLPVRRVSNSCNNNQVLVPCSGVAFRSAPSVGTNHQDTQSSISTSSTHLPQEISNHQDPHRSISTSSTNLQEEKASASRMVSVSLEPDRKRKDPPENTDSLESRSQVTPAFTRNGQNNEECDAVKEALSSELTKKRCMPSIDALFASQDGTGGGEMSEQTTKLRWNPPREIQDKAEPPIPRKRTEDRRNEMYVHGKGGHSGVVIFPHWMSPKRVQANIFGVNNSNQGFLNGLPSCNLSFTTGKETNSNRKLRDGHPQIWIDNIDGPSKADAVKQIELNVVSKLDRQRQGKLLYELALLNTKVSTYCSDQSGHVVRQYDTDLKTPVWMSNVKLDKDVDGLIGFVIGSGASFRKSVMSKTHCEVVIFGTDDCPIFPYVFITGNYKGSVRSAVRMIETRIREYREPGV
eukprot:scaffold30108_cov48-Attheya_sp.AAC.2